MPVKNEALPETSAPQEDAGDALMPTGGSQLAGEMLRGRVLEAVGRRPGIYKSRLCEELEVSWGRLTHHVKVLEESGAVRSVTHGRRVHLFPPGLPEGYMQRSAALKHTPDESVFNLLHAGSLPTLKELSDQAGVSGRVLRQRLDRLAAAGLVTCEGRVRPRYRLTGQAQQRLNALTMVQERLGQHPSPSRRMLLHPLLLVALHDALKPTASEREWVDRLRTEWERGRRPEIPDGEGGTLPEGIVEAAVALLRAAHERRNGHPQSSRVPPFPPYEDE